MPAPYSGKQTLLHCHLDGSFPMFSILPQLFRLTHGDTKAYPFNAWQNHQAQVKAWFGNPLKGNIVEKFSLTTGVMQDRDTLFLAAQNYIRIRARQGYRYCETIIAPQYHTFRGLTPRDVVGELIKGIQAGEKEFPQIEVNLILGIGRETNSDEAVKLVNIFAECDSDYTPAITLVCDEANHPPEKHIAMYRRIKEVGRKKACHVSEWVHDPSTQSADFAKDLRRLKKNARTAIFDLEIDRAEHLRHLAYDPFLISTVVDRGIGVTMCPCSYLSTGLLPDNNMSHLRLDELLDANVLVSIEPDDDLFMDNMDEVFDKCDIAFKLTQEQRSKIITNAEKMKFGNRKRSGPF